MGVGHGEGAPKPLRMGAEMSGERVWGLLRCGGTSDFEGEAGVLGGQSQKRFQGKPRARARAPRHSGAGRCGAQVCSGGQLQWQRRLKGQE